MLFETTKNRYPTEEILVLHMPRFFRWERMYHDELPILANTCPDLSRWVVDLCCGLSLEADAVDVYSRQSEFPEEIFCTVHDEAFTCATSSSLNAVVSDVIERSIYSNTFYDVTIGMITEVLARVHFLKTEDCRLFPTDGIFPILREPNIYVKVNRKLSHFN